MKYKVKMLYSNKHIEIYIDNKFSFKRSNIDYAANAFIRAYIDEVSRIKKRETRRQKIAYLFRKKKDITLKDMYTLVNKPLNK